MTKIRALIKRNFILNSEEMTPPINVNIALENDPGISNRFIYKTAFDSARLLFSIYDLNNNLLSSHKCQMNLVIHESGKYYTPHLVVLTGDFEMIKALIKNHDGSRNNSSITKQQNRI